MCQWMPYFRLKSNSDILEVVASENVSSPSLVIFVGVNKFIIDTIKYMRHDVQFFIDQRIFVFCQEHLEQFRFFMNKILDRI